MSKNVPFPFHLKSVKLLNNCQDHGEKIWVIFLCKTLELVLSKQYLQNNCKIAKWCPEKSHWLLICQIILAKKTLIKLCHRFSDLSFVKFEFFSFVIIKQKCRRICKFCHNLRIFGFVSILGFRFLLWFRFLSFNTIEILE